MANFENPSCCWIWSSDETLAQLVLIMKSRASRFCWNLMHRFERSLNRCGTRVFHPRLLWYLFLTASSRSIKACFTPGTRSWMIVANTRSRIIRVRKHNHHTRLQRLWISAIVSSSIATAVRFDRFDLWIDFSQGSRYRLALLPQ